MTARYDPFDPRYFDPTDLHAEEDRVFDLCHGCRLCFNLCPSFPSLFRSVDAHDGDATALTDAERDEVVDECYQCKLCFVRCPYVPPHEWALDFPRLMLRVHAVRNREGIGLRQRVTDQFLGRTALLGVVGTAAAPLVNRMTGAPGSAARTLMERTIGVAAQRLLPPYARQRFTTWFRNRSHTERPAPPPGAPSPRGADPAATTPDEPAPAPAPAPTTAGAAEPARDRAVRAAVFPTCFVEYMQPEIGRDLVRVYERNGVDCLLVEGARCCGAPWLHSGDVARFQSAARRNLGPLVAAVRSGCDVVVTQPTCAYVLKRDYPLYVVGDEADLVAARTYDPAEYLLALRRGGHPLDLEFPGRVDGSVPDSVTYHAPCHLRAQSIGLKSTELLALAGVHCDVVERCSGIDGTWGYRAEHFELSRQVAAPMAREVAAAGNAVVCGDCTLANGAILQETGHRPVHPIQLLARAYGIPEEGVQ